MNKYTTTKEKNEAGFTLVELMVSLTLFIIVVMAAVSSLYTVNDASRKVDAMRSVLDNLNFAVESMSRTIRTGTHVGCNGNPGSNCSFSNFSNPGSSLTVDSTLGNNGTVVYGLDSGAIKKWSGGNGGIALTAPGINVTRLNFYVEGANQADGIQPKVIMFIQGVATAGQNTAPFAIQTQVSVRSAE